MVTALDNRPAAALGLCTNCKYSAACIHRGNSELAVWHCEEFDDSVRGGAPNLSVASPVGDTPRSGLPGLCGSCAAAATCTFPNREFGVWHCEEFE